jgi:hypothetical protein
MEIHDLGKAGMSVPQRSLQRRERSQAQSQRSHRRQCTPPSRVAAGIRTQCSPPVATSSLPWAASIRWRTVRTLVGSGSATPAQPPNRCGYLLPAPASERCEHSSARKECCTLAHTDRPVEMYSQINLCQHAQPFSHRQAAGTVYLCKKMRRSYCRSFHMNLPKAGTVFPLLV